LGRGQSSLKANYSTRFHRYNFCGGFFISWLVKNIKFVVYLKYRDIQIQLWIIVSEKPQAYAIN
jgi:hypothetical protein